MAGNEPPYLQVGTEVSAKYKGAFCEAKVRKVVRFVKCKVVFKEGNVTTVIPDEYVKGLLKVGVEVEAKKDEDSSFEPAVISRLNDASTYTVVFDDGDVATLRRTQLCPKGDKHFMESETLDQLPLTHPEHFGTPVVQDRDGSHERKRRRSGRGGEAGSGDDSESSSSEEDVAPVKKRTPRTRRDAFVGKILSVEVGDKRKSWYPALAVLSSAHNTDLKKDKILVKSFKDGKFVAVSKKDVKSFTREMALKNEDKSLKASLEKALLYIDNKELPSNWDKEALVGSDTESDETDNESSDDEQTEEKDHFVAQLYKFMDDRGTPLNKGPSLGNKDLNLYKLFKLVQKYGGYNRVTSQMKWRLVYSKMNLPVVSTASHQIKQAYKKYLHAFEDFYRKLGSTMGTISRPGRGQSQTGRRSLLSFREKEATRSPKPERKMPTSSVNTPDEKSKVKESESAQDRRSDDKAKMKVDEKTKVKPDDKSKVKQDEKSKEGRPKNKVDEKPKTQEEKKDEKKTIKSEVDNDSLKRKPSARLSKKDDVEEPELPRRSRSRVEQVEKADSPRRPDSPRRGRPSKLRGDDESSKKGDSDDEASPKKEEDISKKGSRRRSSLRDGSSIKDDGKKVEKKTDKDNKADDSDESDDDNSSSSGKPVESSQKEHEPEYPPGVKVKIRYGRGRTQNVYEAKVMEAELNNGVYQYWVHYSGWNVRYDEWVKKERIVGASDERDLVKRRREWKVENKEKEKTREKEKPMDRKDREKDAVKEKEKEKEIEKPDETAGVKISERKRGRTSTVERSVPCNATLPKNSVSEPVLSKNKPNTPLTQVTRNRPTRSNSVEVKLSALPARVRRRSRRSSGFTESSDVNSHVSDSDESEQSEDEGDTVPETQPYSDTSSSEPPKLLANKMEEEEVKPLDEQDQEMPEINLGSDDTLMDNEQCTVNEQQQSVKKDLIKMEDNKETVDEGDKKEDGRRKRKSDKMEPKLPKEEVKVKSKKKEQTEKVVEEVKLKKEAEMEDKPKSLKRGDSFRSKRRRVSVDRESTPTKVKEEETTKCEVEDKLQAAIDEVVNSACREEEESSGQIEEAKETAEKEVERIVDVEEEGEKKKVKRKPGRKKKEVADASSDKEVKSHRQQEDNDIKKSLGKESEEGSSKPSASTKREKTPESDKGKVEEIVVDEVMPEAKPKEEQLNDEVNVAQDQPSTSAASDESVEKSSTADNVDKVPVHEEMPTTSIEDNTPPTTPEGSPHPVPHNISFEGCDQEQDQHIGEMSVFLDEKTGLPVSGGDSPNDVSTLSNGSGGSSGNAPSEESNGDNHYAQVELVEEAQPKKRKRGHKRTHSEKKAKNTPSKSHVSDSDDGSNHESVLSSSCASSTRVSPTKRLHSDQPPRTPRPSKYDFCSNLDLEDLEGEKRIAILQERITDIRKTYMQLKSEVATIDRRRKRAKRKEREEKANQSPPVEVESS